jgi:hypothetical protein
LAIASRGRAVVRRDHRLTLAEEDAQPEIVALRPLELLGLAEALGMRDRRAFEQHGVGGVGAGPPGAGDQVTENVERVTVWHWAPVMRGRMSRADRASKLGDRPRRAIPALDGAAEDALPPSAKQRPNNPGANCGRPATLFRIVAVK